MIFNEVDPLTGATRDAVYIDHRDAAALNIKEGDKFIANVIGQRFELNDKYISIIAQLKDMKYIEPRFSDRPPVKGSVDC